jgi:hypothetical protein
MARTVFSGCPPIVLLRSVFNALSAPSLLPFLREPLKQQTRIDVDWPLLANQSGNNTQIAAPQRATNQANESQTSTSSRVMVGFCQMMSVQPRSTVVTALMHYLNNLIQSCYCAPMICVLVPEARNRPLRAMGTEV